MKVPRSGHEAVLLGEVMELLLPAEGKIIVDCTVGRGGHSSQIARRLGKSGTLIGLDIDPANLEFALDQLEPAPAQVRLFHANFAELEEVLKEVGVAGVDGILADL